MILDNAKFACCHNAKNAMNNEEWICFSHFFKDICLSEWSMHSKYLVNSAKQFCLTLPKNSKPQRVTSLPSDKHFRGSGSSFTHSMNSCKRKKYHYIILKCTLPFPVTKNVNTAMLTPAQKLSIDKKKSIKKIYRKHTHTHTHTQTNNTAQQKLR